MTRRRYFAGALVGLGLALPTSAVGGDPPPQNVLSGVVVSKADGAPVAGVPVVMAHRAKGYVYFNEEEISGSGDDERVLGIFKKRNSDHFVQTVTDSEGRFTLKNFAAPDERWYLAAGSGTRGYALRVDFRPAEFMAAPLKVELEPPAYVRTTAPPAPDKNFRTYVGIALAPTVEGAGDEETEQVYFWGGWNASGSEPVRMGPLPAGLKYRVTANMTTQQLPYWATLFQREVRPLPGKTEEVVLSSAVGAAVSGRITNHEDKPLANVNVKVRTTDGMVIGVLTNDEGKYELKGVPPGKHVLELLRHAARAVPG